MRKLIVVALLFLIACESTEDRRDKFFQMGNQALSNGQFERAIEMYNLSLKEDAKYTPAINNRGVAKMELDHPYEAILDYNQAIAIQTGYKDAMLNRAYAYEATGQFEKALRDVDAVLALAPDSSFIHFYKGLVETKLKRYDVAYQSFLTSDSLNPMNPETIINMATLHYFKGELNRAEEKVAESLELLPDDANALNLLSLIELERGNFQAALAEINRALDQVSEEPYFLNNRGYIYLEMDSLKLALEDINRSIVLNPKNGWAYRNKGIYWMKKEDFNEAIRLFELAIESGEFIDELYYYLGSSYQQSGDMDQACAIWKEGANSNEEKSKLMLNQNCD